MKVTPEIITPPNPVGADAAVKELQDILAGLYYLDGATQKLWFEGGLIFGLSEGDEPSILWKGKDFYSLMPDDNFTIIAFFYESDPRTQDYSSNEYEFNLIVWFNQDKIKRVPYRLKEYLINDIQNAFDNETFRLYKKNIFGDFKLKDNNFINARFDGFRIKLKYVKEYECGVKLNIQ